MEFLTLSDRIRVLPVRHGSGDFAVEVRRRLLAEPFDCLAVPLPESVQLATEAGVAMLPGVTCVVAREETAWGESGGAFADDEEEEDLPSAAFVPVEPCQPVIAALRVAIQERVPRAFIDAESCPHRPMGAWSPDPYVLKHLSLEAFSAAMLPAMPTGREMKENPTLEPLAVRCRHMAARLRGLERRHRNVVFVCNLLEWPWVLDAYLSGTDEPADDALMDGVAREAELFRVEPRTTAFLTEELPFVAGQYEHRRANLDEDATLSVDGIKELLLETRERYQEKLGRRARPLSPQLFETFLKYVRNLSLVERRLTPDLYSLATAGQQIAGDTFAVSLVEAAREYPYEPDEAWLPKAYLDEVDLEGGRLPTLHMGMEAAAFPDGDVLAMSSRLPGPERTWRTLDLKPVSDPRRSQQWQMRWNPFYQCSWPPEDTAIERFRTHVKDAAMSLVGHDLARSEKFQTSLKDGLDIRETLRHWHTGDLYVKELPPSVGTLDAVVMLFDSPADPRDYPYRITWRAEHHDESTLGFFATQPTDDIVGPGIALARYGGAMFLFPPRDVPEIWVDARLDFCDTLEERLIAAACMHSQERHVALLAPGPPGRGWKRLAKRYGKSLVHVPSSRFGQQQLEQLRMFHVLNGRDVRSYAAEFIRKA